MGLNLKEDMSLLNSIYACYDARDFVLHHGGLEPAWEKCDRVDWLLWMAWRVDADSRSLTRAKAECASIAINHVNDDYLKEGLKCAIAYADGAVSEIELDRVSMQCHYICDSDGLHESIRNINFGYTRGINYYAGLAASYAVDLNCTADVVAIVLRDIWGDELRKFAPRCRGILKDEVFKKTKEWRSQFSV